MAANKSQYMILGNIVNLKTYSVIKKCLKLAYDSGRGLLTSAGRNAIFLNSIPKSGTHLAHQVLMQFHYRDNFGFYATTPSWNMKVRSISDAKTYLAKMYNNEIMSGHLFYSKEMEDFLSGHSIPSVFIYRDPRAIFLSELHYLSNMNKWHKCHGYYSRCSSFDEQFELCLGGIKTNKFYYPEFSQRIKDYLGWMSSQAVFSIQFEELINESKREGLINDLQYYLESYCRLSSDKLFLAKKENMLPAPNESHTYTGLAPDRWRTDLNHCQISKLNEHLGDVVTDMGYMI